MLPFDRVVPTSAMSGAEVIAIVGIVANFAQVAQSTVSVVQRVSRFCNDANELPKVLKEVEIVSSSPLLSDISLLDPLLRNFRIKKQAKY